MRLDDLCESWIFTWPGATKEVHPGWRYRGRSYWSIGSDCRGYIFSLSISQETARRCMVSPREKRPVHSAPSRPTIHQIRSFNRLNRPHASFQCDSNRIYSWRHQQITTGIPWTDCAAGTCASRRQRRQFGSFYAPSRATFLYAWGLAGLDVV